MTREEKQKAIDALKISAPIMAVTQEEFNTYIQTINKVMDWLEQEPVLDKIRAEIEQTAKDYDKFADYRRVRGLWIALDIIDKYKGESEDAE